MASTKVTFVTGTAEVKRREAYASTPSEGLNFHYESIPRMRSTQYF